LLMMDQDKERNASTEAREANDYDDRSGRFRAGPLTINIPARCPDKAVFESVVREELNDHFGNDTYRAAFCKAEYDRCGKVPAAFRQNPEAQRHYQKAQMALSPDAQQWDRFDDAVFARFLDNTDDGDEQTPPIPGWCMDGSLQATVRDRSHRRGAEQGKDRGRDR
jgi:hypothetical protein